jgi:tripartite ATP-independent transporter DctM subunit
MSTLLIVVFFLSLALGLPIAFCLGLTSLVAVYLMDVPLGLIAQRMFTGMDSFPLMAVPFFVLAGDLMNVGGTTRGLINFSNVLVGRIRGGLAHTNIVASMFLAGISGSAVADASAIATIMVPGMVRAGYGRGFAAALTAAASTMGPIIPPSIFMVIMGVTTGVSIGALFAAGFIPGVLMGCSMMGLSYYLALKRNYPKDPEPFSLGRVWKAFVDAGPALLAPVIIIGGILGGIFTPTEAAVVAVFYALFVGVFYYRALNFKNITTIIVNSATTTAVLLFIIGTANVFAWVLTAEQIPQRIATQMLAITRDPYLILLLINLFLIVVGMFMEGGAAIIILAPTLMKVIETVGINPLHFGFIMVLNIVVGLLTPPMGVCLFVVSGITGESLSNIIREVFPFILVEIGVLLLATYFPVVVMIVPKLLGYVQ